MNLSSPAQTQSRFANGWLPSRSQLELLRCGDIDLRDNDYVVRQIQLVGKVDRSRLRAAVRACVQRHVLLSCAFESPGDPQLSVGAFAPTLTYVDQPSTKRARLFGDPLVRFELSPSSSGDASLLTITANHAVMDARSMVILVNDLFRAYAAGSADPLGVAPVSFGEWTHWEFTHLASERGKRLSTYWAEKLSEVGPLPSSGFASTSPRSDRDAARAFHYLISNESAQFIEAIAPSVSSNQFTVISAVWKAAQWATRAEISGITSTKVAVLGSFPNRARRVFEAEVGGYAHPVVIVSDVQANENLRELSQREAQELFLAACHQDYPHSEIVLGLAPSLYGVRYKASLSSIPRYINLDMPEPPGMGLPVVADLTLSYVRDRRAQMPRGGLRIVVRRAGDGWDLDGRYDPKVYSDRVVSRLLGRFDALLDAWIKDHGLRLRDALKLRAVDEETAANRWFPSPAQGGPLSPR